MELGLLYEFDVPRPWAGPFAWGQSVAAREQRSLWARTPEASFTKNTYLNPEKE